MNIYVIFKVQLDFALEVWFSIQEVFCVYLNKFEIAVTHSFLIIFCNFLIS